MTFLKKAAVGTAHGKIILIGEHAVVYNMPAIALPFTTATTTVTITASKTETHIDSDYFTGYLSEAPDTLAGFKATYFAICNDLDQTDAKLNIHVDSLIPSERGMGSSAAIATALVKALFNYFGAELTEDLLEGYVSIAEKITHGNPSGLDATVVKSESPVYFKRNESPIAFPLNIDGFLVAADTGIKGQTKEAVGDVAQLIKSAKGQAMDAVQTIGQLTRQARRAITDNNLDTLGDIFNQAHQLLKELTVSNPQLDELVQSALSAGAFGAKLTGGGRGGCMIALAKSSEHAQAIAQALENAGAIKTWVHPLGAVAND